MKKLFPIFLIAFAFACGEKEVVLTPEQLLAAAEGGWIVTGVMVTVPGSGEVDAYAQYDDCDKDDLTFFVSNGQYRVENPVKCDNSEPTIFESGTWTLSSDKKVISFDPSNDDPYEATILELTSTILKITVQLQFTTGTYTSTITAKPK